MAPLSEHPSVKRFREKGPSAATQTGPTTLDAGWLRQLCLDAGAEDVGFVEIDRPELGDEHTEIVRLFPRTRALISFVLRMNREPVRSPARSMANVELLAFSKCFPS